MVSKFSNPQKTKLSERGDIIRQNADKTHCSKAKLTVRAKFSERKKLHSYNRSYPQARHQNAGQTQRRCCTSRLTTKRKKQNASLSEHNSIWLLDVERTKERGKWNFSQNACPRSIERRNDA
jgi:hypothetical protein